MSDIKVYHEKQVFLRCGMHCVNNLLQGPYFTAEDFEVIGANLNNPQIASVGGARYTRFFGNFDANVIAAALDTLDFGCDWVGKKSREELRYLCDSPRLLGFLVNESSFFTRHWWTIRKFISSYGTPVWSKIDSKDTEVTMISDSGIITELTNLLEVGASTQIIAVSLTENVPPTFSAIEYLNTLRK